MLDEELGRRGLGKGNLPEGGYAFTKVCAAHPNETISGVWILNDGDY